MSTPSWADVVNSNALGFSAGFDLGATQGYAEGYADGWADAQRDKANRQVSSAGVQNIATELARAKVDGREPRLYAGEVTR